MGEMIISFDAFVTRIKENILSIMPAEYQSGKYEIKTEEITDNYGQSATWISIENKREKLKAPERLNLFGCYENYKRIGDFDKVLRVMGDLCAKKYEMRKKEEALKYENQTEINVERMYVVKLDEEALKEARLNTTVIFDKEDGYYALREKTSAEPFKSRGITLDQLQLSGLDKDELYEKAYLNVQNIIPLKVQIVPGSQRIESESYIVKKLKGTTWEMYDETVYKSIAEKSGKSVLIMPIGNNAKMIVTMGELLDYTEAKEAIAEMESNGVGLLKGNIELYELSMDRIRTGDVEIEEALGVADRKKRSIFQR